MKPFFVFRTNQKTTTSLWISEKSATNDQKQKTRQMQWNGDRESQYYEYFRFALSLTPTKEQIIGKL